LNVGTITATLSPQSWDPADWNFKTAQDAGMYYDRLLSADLTISVAAGGRYPFKSDSFLPADAVRGALAERWRWLDDPLRLEVTLRKGVMFPAKPGVMAERELTAQDVVYSFNRLVASPRKIPEFLDFIERVEASDRYTVVHYARRFQADWEYRYGYGIFSAIYPKEVVDAGIGDWRKANGSGPFQLAEYVNGNSQTYTRNPLYWGRERVAGEEYRLPFVDRVVIRIIKDVSTQHAALRTGKLDLLQGIGRGAAEGLRATAPQLKWSSWLSQAGRYMAMRVDTRPFDDIRVRRALNMAVNKQEIVASFYGGEAQLFAYPQHPDYVGYFEPLDAMPQSVRELFTYDPDKARKLLAEAGYAKGFAFKAQVCTCMPEMMDLAQLVAAYLEKVGVKVQIEPIEQGAFFSLMMNGRNEAGFFLSNTNGNPTQTLRKNFVKGQYTNNSHWADPEFARKLDSVDTERDESVRQKVLKELTVAALEAAPHLWLPTPYVYTAWWPWVKNYAGEIYAGGFWFSPIYARIWIDQDLKKRMGF
jgi:peptide/nickel transport system substrate-binding protein